MNLSRELEIARRAAFSFSPHQSTEMNSSTYGAVISHPLKTITSKYKVEPRYGEFGNKSGDRDDEPFVKRAKIECTKSETIKSDQIDSRVVSNNDYEVQVKVDVHLDQIKMDHTYCATETKCDIESPSESDDSNDVDDSDVSDNDFTEVPLKSEESSPIEPDVEGDVKLKFIHDVLKHLKTVYMNEPEPAKTYDEVIRALGLQQLGSSLFKMIRLNSAKKESKIAVTPDGKLCYKPKYKVRNAEELMELLSPTSGELPGISLDDIKDSLPKHQEVFKALGDRIRFARGKGSGSHVIFANRPHIVGYELANFAIDDKIVVYLRESIDDERYYIAKKIGKHLAVKRKSKVQVGVKRAFRIYRDNAHLQSLEIYKPNEMNTQKTDEVAVRSKDTELPVAGKMLIWAFTSQVFRFEDTLILYNLAQNPGMSQNDLLKLLKLKIREINESLTRLDEHHLIYAIDDKSRGACYFVRLKAVVTWVKKRLENAKEKIDEYEKTSARAISYACSRCKMTFNELDIKQLVKGDDWAILVCWFCQAQVHDVPPKEVTRELTIMFNEQTKHLDDLIKELNNY